MGINHHLTPYLPAIKVSNFITICRQKGYGDFYGEFKYFAEAEAKGKLQARNCTRAVRKINADRGTVQTVDAAEVRLFITAKGGV